MRGQIIDSVVETGHPKYVQTVSVNLHSAEAGVSWLARGTTWNFAYTTETCLTFDVPTSKTTISSHDHDTGRVLEAVDGEERYLFWTVLVTP